MARHARSSETVAGITFPPVGVTAVVFDMVGTLVEPATTVAETYAAAGRRLGVELDPPTISRRFSAAWRQQEAIDAGADVPYATSRDRERRRWRQIVDDVFGPGEPAAAIFADLWDHYARPESWRPVGRGMALARAASAAGLTVAVASNFDERLLAVAPALDPGIRTGGVFPSSEIGWRKPKAEFFRHLEGQLGRRPGELLYVGDDPDLDVAAAAAAGWRSLLVS
jgi:putative hydrolase of the HAD superfamily